MNYTMNTANFMGQDSPTNPSLIQNVPNSQLQNLIAAADAQSLGQLVLKLANQRPELRRECFEFLQQHVHTESAKIDAQTGAVWALWDEIQAKMGDLEKFEGSDAAQERVAEKIHQVAAKLEDKKTRPSQSQRRELQDAVLANLDSGSPVVDDALHLLADAACETAEDFHALARRLEVLRSDMARSHARRIYRKLGDRDRFLALRLKRLETGADYHDLASFYWDQGDRQQAMATAYEGLQTVKGRMDELRSFLADRAKEFGDRQGFLELQFAQRTRMLTLENYRAFESQCTPDEWAHYEPRMLAVLPRAKPLAQLRIHLYRQEFPQAVAVFSQFQYTEDLEDAELLLSLAAQLEAHATQIVLQFYLAGLALHPSPGLREFYIHQTTLALKARRLWVEVLKDPAAWETYLRDLKAANRRRSAFQEEFSKAIPEWNHR